MTPDLTRHTLRGLETMPPTVPAPTPTPLCCVFFYMCWRDGTSRIWGCSCTSKNIFRTVWPSPWLWHNTFWRKEHYWFKAKFVLIANTETLILLFKLQTFQLWASTQIILYVMLKAKIIYLYQNDFLTPSDFIRPCETLCFVLISREPNKWSI